MAGFCALEADEETLCTVPRGLGLPGEASSGHSCPPICAQCTPRRDRETQDRSCLQLTGEKLVKVPAVLSPDRGLCSPVATANLKAVNPYSHLSMQKAHTLARTSATW